MKTTIKRIIACVVFCLVVVSLIFRTNEVLINKTNNRYYILEQFIEDEDREYVVQTYGSCHAYTSFDSSHIEEKYGLSSYVFANPGEIIPTTYLRMRERFKVDAPKVAVVDIWGMNPYETYSTQEKIFDFYMPVNIELIPFSLEKMEVIRDFGSLDMITDNFAIAKYKDRILGMELTKADFEYSFESIAAQGEEYVQNEMTLRKNNNGFAAYNPQDYIADLKDFTTKQPQVDDTELLPYEQDIMKYVKKIISLCKKYDVKLVFYRAPYLSTANELKKSNWFEGFCEENDIPYFDLEKEVSFDYSKDFFDYYHLNEAGAIKATDYLAQQILPLM